MIPAVTQRLLTALTARLREVLPVELTPVVDDDNVLRIIHDGDLLGGILVEAMLASSGQDDQDAIAAAATFVLSDVQDVVATILATPWPAAAHAQPMPFAIVGDNSVHLGYGEPGRPELALRPIAIAELLG